MDIRDGHSVPLRSVPHENGTEARFRSHENGTEKRNGKTEKTEKRKKTERKNGTEQFSHAKTKKTKRNDFFLNIRSVFSVLHAKTVPFRFFRSVIFRFFRFSVPFFRFAPFPFRSHAERIEHSVPFSYGTER